MTEQHRRELPLQRLLEGPHSPLIDIYRVWTDKCAHGLPRVSEWALGPRQTLIDVSHENPARYRFIKYGGIYGEEYGELSGRPVLEFPSTVSWNALMEYNVVKMRGEPMAVHVMDDVFQGRDFQRILLPFADGKVINAYRHI